MPQKLDATIVAAVAVAVAITNSTAGAEWNRDVPIDQSMIRTLAPAMIDSTVIHHFCDRLTTE